MGISILGYCTVHCTVHYETTTVALQYCTVQSGKFEWVYYSIIIITVQYSTVSISLHCTSTVQYSSTVVLQ